MASTAQFLSDIQQATTYLMDTMPNITEAVARNVSSTTIRAPPPGTTPLATTHLPFEKLQPLLFIAKMEEDIPEFEVVLPCIFGIFIVLSLSLIVFFSKDPFSKEVDRKQVEQQTVQPVENGSVPHL